MSEELERHKKAIVVMGRFGQAIRGDWGTIDGRTISRSFERLGEYATFGDDADTYESGLRNEQIPSEDLCWQTGRGHWMDHCDDSCFDPWIEPPQEVAT